MKLKNSLISQILRLDWAIYLLVVAALLCAFVAEVPAALQGASAGPKQSVQVASPLADLSLGAIYSFIVWVAIPLIAFIVVNVRGAKKFRSRLGESAPVEPEVPTVQAKKAPVDLNPTLKS